MTNTLPLSINQAACLLNPAGSQHLTEESSSGFHRHESKPEERFSVMRVCPAVLHFKVNIIILILENVRKSPLTNKPLIKSPAHK